MQVHAVVASVPHLHGFRDLGQDDLCIEVQVAAIDVRDKAERSLNSGADRARS